MRIARILLALAAVAGLLAVGAGESFAFKFRDPNNVADKRPDQPGPYRHWDLREFTACSVPYSWTNNCRDVANVGPSVVNAAASWSAVAPSNLVLSAAAQADSVLYDGKNSIFWDNSNMAGQLPVGNGILAITVPTYLTVASGRLDEVDIVMNDQEFLWTTTLGDSSADAIVFSAAGTYDFDQNNDGFIDNNVLNVTIHGTDARVCTFVAGDFANLNAATRTEVRNAINAHIGGFVNGHRVLANSYGPPNNNVSMEDDPQLPIGNTTGVISIQVTGGSANAILGFPGGLVRGARRFDVETVVLHELGHLLGLAHTDPDTVPVMYAFAPNTGTKRVLTNDDKTAINVLYTPDDGDAPDNPYPSIVRSAANSRTLNAVQLKAPDDGAQHVFGYKPGFQYEWLGPEIDNECESRQVDLDNYDDGGGFAQNALYPCALDVTRIISIAADDSGRSHTCAGPNLVYFNAWFDWNDNGVWEEPPEHNIAENYCASATVTSTIAPTTDPCPDHLWIRFRLDWAENVGAVGNINGDLADVHGVAQWGEVEDYFVDFRPTPVGLLSFAALDEGNGARIVWTTTEDRDVIGFHVYRAGSGAPGLRLSVSPVRGTPSAGGSFDYEFVDPAPPGSGEVTYTIEEVRSDGGRGQTFGPLELTRRPLGRLLRAPYPNPARGPVTIQFVADQRREALLEIFDLGGRLVAKVSAGPVDRGVQTVTWDGRDGDGKAVAAGLYLVRLKLDDWTSTRKVVVER
jgi:hypothetical protein